MLGENFKIQKLGENSPEFLKSDFSKKCNSRCSAWENFKSEFENEITPDAVNFGQFATNRGNACNALEFS